jgi:hypothetical protein
MRKTLVIICSFALIAVAISNCNPDRIAYHNRNGRVRYARGKRMLPWFAPAGSGYDKYSRKSMHRWDKSLR